MHIELSPLIVWIAHCIVNSYSEFQVDIFSNDKYYKISKFLQDDNNDTKAIAIPQVFSENSQAKNCKLNIWPWPSQRMTLSLASIILPQGMGSLNALSLTIHKLWVMLKIFVDKQTGQKLYAPTYPYRVLTLSQTSPGFYVSGVQVFWKHCGKRKNCSWRAISPFPTVFATCFKNLCHFHQIWNCRLQTLSIGKSLKLVVWERVKYWKLSLERRRHCLKNRKCWLPPLSMAFFITCLDCLVMD